MKYRSAADILAVVKARGLFVTVDPGPPPMPLLHAGSRLLKDEGTEPLLAALRAWRLEIISEVGTHLQEK